DEDVYTLPQFHVEPESERKAKVWQADIVSIKFDLKPDKYISCIVGRECSLARYKLEGASDLASLLHNLASADRGERDDFRPTKRQKEDHDSGAMSE
ncbi:hypothetical protein CFC21_005459, partial [Triticum aestivum]